MPNSRQIRYESEEIQWFTPVLLNHVEMLFMIQLVCQPWDRVPLFFFELTLTSNTIFSTQSPYVIA